MIPLRHPHIEVSTPVSLCPCASCCESLRGCWWTAVVSRCVAWTSPFSPLPSPVVCSAWLPCMRAWVCVLQRTDTAALCARLDYNGYYSAQEAKGGRE